MFSMINHSCVENIPGNMKAYLHSYLSSHRCQSIFVHPLFIPDICKCLSRVRDNMIHHINIDLLSSEPQDIHFGEIESKSELL